MQGGKPVNVSSSITPLKGERLTDTRPKPQWIEIDWKKVEEHVNRLQTRITKAVKERKWHLVKRLQYLLTHSFYAKLLAVKRVTQNRGKRTAGVDGETWTTPKSKMSAGFRKYRSAHDACEYAFACLSTKNSALWVLEGDIKGCFDNINHDWLLENIPLDKAILKQFLKAGFVYNHHLNPTKAGTPQGGIISPLLANMALDELEMTIASRYHAPKSGIINKGRCNPHKVNFVRYADDFIVTAASEEIAKEIAELINGFLKKRGLELSVEKTHITHIDAGFDFLGWHFRKYKGKLLIKPSKKSISKTWIVRRYWHSEGPRNWVFSTERNRLKLFSDTKIVRHTSLKLDKNPYLDSEYFKLRKPRQKAQKMTDRCKTRWDKLKDSLCT